MKKLFTTTVYGKWILSGEHAVLRGHPALIFPLKNKACVVDYFASDTPLQINVSGEYADKIKKPFEAALVETDKLLEIKTSSLTGILKIENHIPVGTGLGASGALCVALARWLEFLGYLKENELFEFARDLENLFHGKSSGADIAVSLANSPIKFYADGRESKLNSVWQPQWYLSFSSVVSSTAECIQKVEKLWQTNPTLAKQTDLDMARSVELAETALNTDSPESIQKLAEAINLGSYSFKTWGLCNKEITQHMNTLTEAGAAAVKPVGSGNGGYVLSLWDNTPPDNLLDNLIELKT